MRFILADKRIKRPSGTCERLARSAVFLKACTPTPSAGPLRAARPSLRPRFRGGSSPSENSLKMVLGCAEDLERRRVGKRLRNHKLPLGNFAKILTGVKKLSKLHLGNFTFFRPQQKGPTDESLFVKF